MDQLAASFFIADRLRGIPLVSGGRKRSDNIDENTSEKDRVSVGTTTTTTTTTSAPTTKSSSLAATFVRPQNKMGNKGARDQRANERPEIATTTPASSPRKPTTTTIRRPQISRQNLLPNLSESKSKSKPSSSTTTTTTTMKPNTIRKQQQHHKFEPEPMRASKMQLLADKFSSSKGSSVEYANGGQEANQLTRANQTTTDFGHQRRNPQTVMTPRFTNKLNEVRPAGENWIIFNRNDGRMSVFEVIALVSNIMIVGTIVFVILFNWCKSLKKKRLNLQKRQDLEQPKDGGGSRQPESSRIGSRPSSELGRQSMISSGLSGTSSINKFKQQPAGGEEASKNRDGSMNQAQKLADHSHQKLEGEGRFGSPHNISSEFKGSANAIANKAMAIVQPSENMGTISGPFSETEKLAEELATKDPMVEQPASNMLGGFEQKLQAQQAAQIAKSTAPAATTKGGSSSQQPQAEVSLTEANRTEPFGKGEGEGSHTKRIEATEKKLARSNSRLSASSLESTELPGSLVESIKRSDPAGDPASVVPPSPNLLLGEKDDHNNKLATTKAGATAVPVKQKTMINGSNKASIKEGKAAEKPAELPSDQMVKSKMEQAEVEVKPKGAGSIKQPKSDLNCNERPTNPMCREEVGGPAAAAASPNTRAAQETHSNATPEMGKTHTRVKNHQIVVNKLDKRKTNLEIVDLRDESVTGKMRDKNADDPKSSNEGEMEEEDATGDKSGNWISMDGVAVVQPQAALATNSNGAQMLAQQQTINQQQQQQQTMASQQQQMVSPSEIIESRFHVDYGSKKKRDQKGGEHKESQDSKSERESLGNIETELELVNNKMRNRKYFVYIVNDGHFTAKKECIARIELPQKRRITLAEMRQLITNSQDISLSSLRRNKFKFVTETYRLLNENEDAAVLHQVYPTQGVFLKLNVPEQEGKAFTYNARSRLSSGSSGPYAAATSGPSSLSQTTISSRRRVATRQPARTGGGGGGPASDQQLPAIEVDYAQGGGGGQPRSRAASVGRSRGDASSTGGGPASRLPQGSLYRRSKSSVQAPATRRAAKQQRSAAPGDNQENGDKLPSIDLLTGEPPDDPMNRRSSFTATPLADMSDTRMRIIASSKYCSRACCGRLATIRCGICGHSYYCSVHCRISDWSQHKQFCKSTPYPAT